MNDDFFDEPDDEFFGGMLDGLDDDLGFDEDTSDSGPRITLRCGPFELETEGRPDDTLAAVQAAHLDMVEQALASVLDMPRTAWHRFWMDP